jgi:hypothetical protein
LTRILRDQRECNNAPVGYSKLRGVTVILRRISELARAITMDLKSEISRTPGRGAQVATTAMCVIAATVAMPALHARVADQREDAQWRERTAALRETVDITRNGAAAEVRLAALPGVSGYLAAAGSSGQFRGDLTQAGAMFLRTSLDNVPSAVLAPPKTPAAIPVPEASSARERRCLAEAVYYEARGETLAGQKAVAEVVLNRVASRFYPNTICGVVYQGSERRTGCQFSFTCDGSMNRGAGGPAWVRAQRVADHMLLGLGTAQTGRATHYHTTAVSPVWAGSLVRTGQIGVHLFYRLPNRVERAGLVTRRGRSAPEVLPEGVDAKVASELGDESTAAATVVDRSREVVADAAATSVIRTASPSQTDAAQPALASDAALPVATTYPMPASAPAPAREGTPAAAPAAAPVTTSSATPPVATDARAAASAVAGTAG